MNLLAKIEELREPEKKATPAPWKWIYDGTCADSYGSLFGGDDGAVISTCCDSCRGDDDIVKNEADRDFIPALRNAAPDLLAALDFRKGDAATLMKILEEDVMGGCDCPACKEKEEVIRRMIDMAVRMEKPT